MLLYVSLCQGFIIDAGYRLQLRVKGLSLLLIQTVFMHDLIHDLIFKSLNGIEHLGLVEPKKGDGRKKNLFYKNK